MVLTEQASSLFWMHALQRPVPPNFTTGGGVTTGPGLVLRVT